MHTISEQKVIGNWFCAPIIFQNSIKKKFSIKKCNFKICVGRVWIVIWYFLFEKQTFNGLLKVIGILKSISCQFGKAFKFLTVVYRVYKLCITMLIVDIIILFYL